MLTGVKMVPTRLLHKFVASFCRAKKLKKAEETIIDGIRLGILPTDVGTYNTLIDANIQFGQFDVACSLLGEMKESGISPDVNTYNSLTAGATKANLISTFVDLFEDMIQEGVRPDIRTYNTIMHAFFKFGRVDEAYKIFQELILSDGDFYVEAASLNIMINGLCKNGYVDNALRLFRYLKRHGFDPGLVAYNSLFNGLCETCKLRTAKGILEKEGLEFDEYTFTIITNAMCKAGEIESALKFLDLMLGMDFNDSNSNLVAVNCVIDGLWKRGRIDEAMKLFESMKKKDCTTYTTMVHNLCKGKKVSFCIQAHVSLFERWHENTKVYSTGCL